MGFLAGFVGWEVADFWRKGVEVGREGVRGLVETDRIGKGNLGLMREIKNAVSGKTYGQLSVIRRERERERQRAAY